MPDYRNIIQELMWQTMDVKPKYPRVNKYLNYWKNNIEAVIADIEIAYSSHWSLELFSTVWA